MRFFVGIVVFWIIILFVYGQLSFQEDCSDAPTKELRRICLRLRAKDKNSRKRFETRRRNKTQTRPPGLSKTFHKPNISSFNPNGRLVTNPYDCMTLICLCPFFEGTLDRQGVCILKNGQSLKPGVRKEYRLMSDSERKKFHKIIRQMKSSGVYDQFSREHRDIAIRLIDPNIGLPYWDSVMDGFLPSPKDSIMFSKDFMGETDFFGNVVVGSFAFWRTIEGNPALTRHLGEDGQLLTEEQIGAVMAQTNVEYVLAFIIPLRGCPFPPNFNAIEYSHANVHVWLGGDMFDQITSANDPIFYLHHSFVDHIWEIWRLLRQPRHIREIAYPPDLPQCASPLHFSRSQLAPYNMMLRDGLSNLYTDQLYTYEHRAACTREKPDCGSKYLFCDLRNFPHCVAKIKIGGKCTGFEMLDSCYNGRCLFGKCVETKNEKSTTPQTPVEPIRHSILESRAFSNCYNNHPCCELWASKGECKMNREFMNEHCQASCGSCLPSYNVTNECQNRHISCAQWKQDGYCLKGESTLFLYENCRESCGLCSISKCVDKPNVGIVVPDQTLQKARKVASKQKKRRQNMRSKKVPKNMKEEISFWRRNMSLKN